MTKAFLSAVCTVPEVAAARRAPSLSPRLEGAPDASPSRPERLGCPRRLALGRPHLPPSLPPPSTQTLDSRGASSRARWPIQWRRLSRKTGTRVSTAGCLKIRLPAPPSPHTRTHTQIRESELPEHCMGVCSSDRQADYTSHVAPLAR